MCACMCLFCLWSVMLFAGSGSIFEALTLGKPLVVAINEQLMDNHQIELARQLSHDNHLVYATCRWAPEMQDVCSQRWILTTINSAHNNYGSSMHMHLFFPCSNLLKTVKALEPSTLTRYKPGNPKLFADYIDSLLGFDKIR